MTSGQRKRQKARTPPPPVRNGIPFVALFKMFVIGSVSILGCIWALARYYTVKLDPMVVPVPSAEAASPDLELVPWDLGGPASVLPSAAPSTPPASSGPPH